MLVEKKGEGQTAVKTYLLTYLLTWLRTGGA